MQTTVVSAQTNASAGPTNPKMGMRTNRKTRRRVKPTQVLTKKRRCWSRAAKRYENRVEIKKGISPMPSSCIAGIAGRYLRPRAMLRIGSDQAAKNAATGMLIRRKNLTLKRYTLVNRVGEKCAVREKSGNSGRASVCGIMRSAILIRYGPLNKPTVVKLESQLRTRTSSWSARLRNMAPAPSGSDEVINVFHSGTLK